MSTQDELELENTNLKDTLSKEQQQVSLLTEKIDELQSQHQSEIDKYQ